MAFFIRRQMEICGLKMLTLRVVVLRIFQFMRTKYWPGPFMVVIFLSTLDKHGLLLIQV